MTLNTPARDCFRAAYRVLRASGSFTAAWRTLERNGQAHALMFLPAADAALAVRTERVVA